MALRTDSYKDFKSIDPGECGSVCVCVCVVCVCVCMCVCVLMSEVSVLCCMESIDCSGWIQHHTWDIPQSAWRVLCVCVCARACVFMCGRVMCTCVFSCICMCVAMCQCVTVFVCVHPMPLSVQYMCGVHIYI